jgi:hypothetical protein
MLVVSHIVAPLQHTGRSIVEKVPMALADTARGLGMIDGRMGLAQTAELLMAYTDSKQRMSGVDVPSPAGNAGPSAPGKHQLRPLVFPSRYDTTGYHEVYSTACVYACVFPLNF